MKIFAILPCLSFSVALAQTVTPGEYIQEGGQGAMVISKDKSDLSFAIDVLGVNAHTCHLEGALERNTGHTKGEDEDSSCTISLTSLKDRVEVKPLNENCRAYCGARADFEGTYHKPKSECTSNSRSQTRYRFKQLFDKKRYANAEKLLSPLLKECSLVMNFFEKSEIRNDLALTFHKLKNKASCLEILKPLSDLIDSPDEEIGATEPSFRDTYLEIAKTARVNKKLCSK